MGLPAHAENFYFGGMELNDIKNVDLLMLWFRNTDEDNGHRLPDIETEKDFKHWIKTQLDDYLLFALSENYLVKCKNQPRAENDYYGTTKVYRQMRLKYGTLHNMYSVFERNAKKEKRKSDVLFWGSIAAASIVILEIIKLIFFRCPC